jgi:hypothetical protein
MSGPVGIAQAPLAARKGRLPARAELGAGSGQARASSRRPLELGFVGKVLCARLVYVHWWRPHNDSADSESTAGPESQADESGSSQVGAGKSGPSVKGAGESTVTKPREFSLGSNSGLLK